MRDSGFEEAEGKDHSATFEERPETYVLESDATMGGPGDAKWR